MIEPIYLDNNATTQLDPEVAELMAVTGGRLQGNPASQHWAGRAARLLLEDAREAIAEMLDVGRGDQLLFTSGGTEANNLAVKGFAGAHGRIVISAVEHPSVMETAKALEASGHEVIVLPVSTSGHLVANAAQQAISPQTRIVSVMWINNETGIIQPLTELSNLCRAASVPLHTDAVQGVGRMATSFRKLGVDALSVAAHKFHGPVGIGALVVHADYGARLRALLHGGPQQLGFRPGTEPVVLAVGMAAALRRWHDHASELEARLRRSRDEFERLLLESEPGIVIHGKAGPRTPQTSCVSFPGVDRQEFTIALDGEGIAASTGSACTSGSSEASHVLIAMGVDQTLIGSAVRFSLSRLTTAAEVASAADRIINLYRQLRQRSDWRKSGFTARQRAPRSI